MVLTWIYGLWNLQAIRNPPALLVPLKYRQELPGSFRRSTGFPLLYRTDRQQLSPASVDTSVIVAKAKGGTYTVRWVQGKQDQRSEGISA
jgi:hypothetical protein